MKEQVNDHYSHVKIEHYKTKEKSEMYLKERYERQNWHQQEMKKQAKELTKEEIDKLYWKLLAPLNYKKLEGKFVLVCPICDADLWMSQEWLRKESTFKAEAMHARELLKQHEPECKAVSEA